MSKRQADSDDLRDASKAATFSSGETSHRAGAEVDEMGEFEDAFEDEIEEDMTEEVINDQNEEENDGKKNENDEWRVISADPTFQSTAYS
jgi:ribosome assembly protein RRB1